jgi:ADP-ribosylglycohydrolase/fructose-1,6-bisphosphatase/inositol monophosphatase family enzyme
MIRAEFHRPGGPRGIGHKAEIDTEVEALLKARLLALLPGGWLGEETPAMAARNGVVWVVDPQDGTADFLAGRRGSAVSVALVQDGRLVLGVVHAPLAPDDGGDLIAWAEGHPLTRNGQPVLRGQHALPPVVAMNARSADGALHHAEALGGLRVRALPSPAYRLALAAAGEVDAAVSLTRGLSPWDIAGGHALLIGAGLGLVDLQGRPVAPGAGAHGCIGGTPDMIARLRAAHLSPSRTAPRSPVRPRRHVADAGRLARAQGCLLGQLAGDALGSAVEFRSASDIARSHPNGVTTLRDGGTWNLIAGQPTDDSEMALALARCLVDRSGFDAQAVGAAYVDWRASGPFDIGGTTSAGIAALAAGRPARSDSQSNGALMRVSPIGILAAGDPARAAHLAAADARLTHPHPVCVAASAAFSAAIAAGIAGADAQAMWAAADVHAGSGPAADLIRQRLHDARDRAPGDFMHQMGWVLTAFQNAFYHLLRGAPMGEAVVQTVAQGGDTDTNGAICGALIGAFQGRMAVPLQWRTAVLTCRPVAAPGIRHPRPRQFWPDDAMELAEALLSATR